MRTLIDNIKDDFYWRRLVWLYRVCWLSNLFYAYLLLRFPATLGFSIFLILVSFSVFFKLIKTFNAIDWEDINMARHETRTTLFYLYFSVLLFLIGNKLLDINVSEIDPSMLVEPEPNTVHALWESTKTYIDYDKMVNQIRESIPTIKKNTPSAKCWNDTFYLVKFKLAGLIYIWWKCWYELAAQLSELRSIHEITPQLISEFIILMLSLPPTLICQALSVLVNFIHNIPIHFWYSLDSIFVQPVVLYIYKLYHYANFTTLIVNFLAIYSFWKRDVFLYDRGLHTPIYIDQATPWPPVDPFYGLAMPEHLFEFETDDHLIFDTQGKKWPSKMNQDYAFYDIDHTKLTPLNNAQFILMKGNIPIDCSDLQFYPNNVPCVTKEGYKYLETRVYNRHGVPYPWINNMEYTLRDCFYTELDIRNYHIFDRRGNKLDSSFFCSTWEETQKKQPWAALRVSRTEHYIFNKKGVLLDNKKMIIRHMKNGKWCTKDPKED